MIMNIFEKLRIDAAVEDIDLEMTPVDTYGLFECRGDTQRVKSKKERYYYFYIDNWEQPPRLCFMERGIRHARVLAYIEAPQDMIDSCIASQGRSYKEQSFAIDENLRGWLTQHVISDVTENIIIPSSELQSGNEYDVDLPDPIAEGSEPQHFHLRSAGRIVAEDEVAGIVKHYGFFETNNPDGTFQNHLVQTDNKEIVKDISTGLLWQRQGSEIGSFRQLQTWMAGINRAGLAGFNDWRLPTIEEALSLLRGEKGKHGSYIHPCFDFKQGYVFTADRRKPGGYWFVDFRQARLYWASGTMAGGFARLCRTSD